jgi:hypothetical protein
MNQLNECILAFFIVIGLINICNEFYRVAHQFRKVKAKRWEGNQTHDFDLDSYNLVGFIYWPLRIDFLGAFTLFQCHWCFGSAYSSRVPALSVVFFHNKMNGIKAIGMVFSIYHHHLDDCKSKTEQYSSV